jgi:hypothetical protein
MPVVTPEQVEFQIQPIAIEHAVPDFCVIFTTSPPSQSDGSNV